MPEVTLSAQCSATPQQAWAFVEHMDNWAPFLTGYQRHETIDERNSIWVVKGELGGLTRIAEFRVQITAWVEPERIAFELEGVDEPFAGHGIFSIAGAQSDPSPAAPTMRPGILQRIRDWIARRILSQIFGSTETAKNQPTAAPNTRLTCTLALNASGGSGPIMNILLAPMLPAIAQDMADKIVAALDQRAAA
ncbi:MAG: SRPBCC family protein [Caulobacterales bacterium]